MAPQLCPEDYTVGWLCALPVELAAAQEMLDEEHHDLERDSADKNLYALGSIGGHNVAIVCPPAGRIGNNVMAVVSTQMRATFKAIRFGLMVGIGGGVPSAGADIRLGDVVVSQPQMSFGGVVQYDSGKATPSGFERTGALNTPPLKLQSAVGTVQANAMLGESTLSDHLSILERIPTFQRRRAGPDLLFKAAYNHEHGATCDQCSVESRQLRPARESGAEVAVHYGTIASGNQVMKDASERDRVSAELGGVLCFEMEAAGLMNSFPCLVIRGICDYADSHKNKRWQPYAAGTAAAYAKELLLMVAPAEMAETHIYTVGWLCALPVELAAAQEMLDEEHHDLERDSADKNLYALGSIGGHNVAIVCPPAGRIGNNVLASVLPQMRAILNIDHFVLMVGIGGGVPSAGADIRLGDVVVSQPQMSFGGVVEYDFGRRMSNTLMRIGSLNSPPNILLSAVTKMQANKLRGRCKLLEHASKLERIAEFQRVKAGPDILFDAAYDHKGGATCKRCDVSSLVARAPRSQDLMVHYGTIASGSQVMKDATQRDRVSAQLGGVLCFETEAAGLMNSFPCLVIRGICDYADSHKNKRWQPYAAGTAAAYAKELLSMIPPAKVAKLVSRFPTALGMRQDKTIKEAKQFVAQLGVVIVD